MLNCLWHFFNQPLKMPLLQLNPGSVTAVRCVILFKLHCSIMFYPTLYAVTIVTPNENQLTRTAAMQVGRAEHWAAWGVRGLPVGFREGAPLIWPGYLKVPKVPWFGESEAGLNILDHILLSCLNDLKWLEKMIGWEEPWFQWWKTCEWMITSGHFIKQPRPRASKIRTSGAWKAGRFWGSQVVRGRWKWQQWIEAQAGWPHFAMDFTR